MARQRRFEWVLGSIFLTAGALLLSTTAVSWFSSMKTPDVIGRVPRKLSLNDLPPALAPALEASTTTDLSTADSAVDDHVEIPEPAASTGVVLLPQPPAAVEVQAIRQTKAESITAQPQRILIPALEIDAPVERAGLEAFRVEQRDHLQWTAPDGYAAGWHESSALPGEGGNIVLNGHNNVHGAIFEGLAHLPVGEQIVLTSEAGAAVYRVTHHELVREKEASLRERLRNARWIEPTENERLTLVTCWPNTTNSHRLIVVAEPVSDVGG